MKRAAGFTLIEVMVALAVLGLSMGVLLQANIQTIASVDRIDGMTQATLLGRSKMLDIERKLYKEGFKADAEEMNGVFEEEGHPEIKWTASIKPVRVELSKLTDLAKQFAGFGGALGGGGSSGSGSKTAAPPPAKTSSSGGSSSGSSGALAAIDSGDPLAMIRPLLDPVAQGISQNLRFVKLEVSWPEGTKRRGSFAITAMITSKALQQSQQQATGQAGNNTAGGTTNGVQNPTTQTGTAAGVAGTAGVTPTGTTAAGVSAPTPVGISH